MQQNTAEWLEWRRQGLGASDASIIMGVSPYKTRRQLWENKLKLRPDDGESFVTQLGHDFEPVARARFALETNIDLQADVCMTHPEFPYLRASLDGHCNEARAFAEIKMMGKKKIETIRQTKKPLDEHWPQVQQQFLVTKFERGFYIAYALDDQKKQIVDYECIQVAPDKTYIETLFKELTAFWRLIETQTPPELEARDEYVFKDKKITAMADEYIKRKKILDDAQKDFDEIEDTIKKVASNKHPTTRIGALSISTVVRKGNVNYAKIPQLNGVDLEKFRGNPTTYKQIRVKE